MVNIKLTILNFFFKFEVLSDLPGRLRLKVSHYKKIPENMMVYQKDAVEAIKRLNGVKNVTFNAVIGTTIIEYDKDELDSKKIIEWLNDIKKLAADNIDLISQLDENSEEKNRKMLFGILDEYTKVANNKQMNQQK